MKEEVIIKRSDKLQKVMRQLHRELEKEFLTHHYNHMDVWFAYWKLLDKIDS